MTTQILIDPEAGERLCKCGHTYDDHYLNTATLQRRSCAIQRTDSSTGYKTVKCDCAKFQPHGEFSLDQPPPTPESPDKPAIWDLVIADMQERDQVGRTRYGTPLQPDNGRDALADAYAEALDLAVYLRQMLYERNGA